MKILAVDSSGMVASAAVLENDILLAEYTVNHKKTHSQTLLPMIDEIMRMLGMEPKELDALAVAAGPGSYTGLRIGSATVKGIGLALDRPVIEVPTVDALAYNLYDAEGLICPMMDARRSQVYTGIYRFAEHRLQTVLAQHPASVEETAARLNREGEPVTLLGDGVPVYLEQLAGLLTVPFSVAPAHLSRQRAAAVGALAMQYAAEGKMVSAAMHRPVYLRLSQAERERAEKLQYRIRRMTPDDLQQILEIEKGAFSVPWSRESLLDFLNREDTVFLAAVRPAKDAGKPAGEPAADGRPSGEDAGEKRTGQAAGEEILGYCGLLAIPDEGELLNIAVRQDSRGQGIGTRLMEELIRASKPLGVRSVFLEVRESNLTARGLYEKFGFRQTGLRRNYYQMPQENAVIMVRKAPEGE